ncbi:hypothetical protein NPIL_554751 [Nephila pilipes]|uniref:Uncharacterized protein n=1 Tax=Nephila pilipes TaxID=299642 RepID=A0A8X6MZ08_NEPPI|nr:hypothetical protein NPIL_554751 [Nephila pilipes]
MIRPGSKGKLVYLESAKFETEGKETHIIPFRDIRTFVLKLSKIKSWQLCNVRTHIEPKTEESETATLVNLRGRKLVNTFKPLNLIFNVISRSSLN